MARLPAQIMSAVAMFLEREAGHVLVAFGLIALGAAFTRMSIPKGEDLIVFALGLMGRSIGSRKPKERINGPQQ